MAATDADMHFFRGKHRQCRSDTYTDINFSFKLRIQTPTQTFNLFLDADADTGKP